MKDIDYLVVAPLSTLGQKEYYFERVKMLRELKYKTEIVSFTLKKSRFPKLGPLYSLRNALVYRIKLNKILKKINPKVIEFQNTVSILQCNKLFKKYKTVISFDHPYLLQIPWYAFFLKCLENRKLKKAHLLISRTKYAQQKLSGLSKIEFIPHTIKTKVNRKSNKKEKYVLSYCSPNEFYIKGLDILINAWSEYKKHKENNEKLVIAGITREEAQNYLMKKGIKLSNEYLFLGKIQRADFLKRIESAVIVINSARREEFGRTTIEALSSGKVVIATPTKGSIEILNNINPELISKSFSSTDLAKLLIKKEKLIKKNKNISASLRDYEYNSVKDKLSNLIKTIK